MNESRSVPLVGGEAEYLSSEGQKFLVEVVKSQNESNTYSFFTLAAKKMWEGGSSDRVRVGDVGIASVFSERGVAFFKGGTFARITNLSTLNSEQPVALARLWAGTLGDGDGDIPVLVKHLPEWQTAQAHALYAVSLATLREMMPGEPILDAISFESGTEAVTAAYGSSQLLIVEFATPQLAGENDRRIAPKIEELRAQGQLVPSAYRRVGNYSVFVFNAPDEKAANQLIDQVKYEQVVRWLGDNPYWYEKAVREWAQTSADVVLTVLKSSGLSALVCLGIGTAIGALLFRRRRALKQGRIYSDAGGMVRLNLDEMTGGTDSSGFVTDSRKH